MTGGRRVFDLAASAPPLTLAGADGDTHAALRVEQAGAAFVRTGTIGADSIVARMARLERSSFLLVNHGVSWLIDGADMR